MGFVLPYSYNDGDYKPDSFEDITQKNVSALARSQGIVNQLRLLHGCVSSAGAFISGTNGWSVTKTGTGTYTISFERAFAGAPSLLFGAITGTATGLAVPGSADVSTFNIGGGAADHSFYFFTVL